VEKWVVVNTYRPVLRTFGDASRLKLPGDCRGVVVERLGDRITLACFLAQKNLSSDGFDVRIVELYSDGKAVEEPLKVRGSA
jgi:hypothetical protein